jgi:xylobiose transport system substrate-binding protein
MSEPYKLSRRGLLTGAASVGALGALSACSQLAPGAAPGSKSDGGVAQIWVNSDDVLNPIQQKAVDRFNATSKTTMKLVPIPSTQSMNDKVRAAINTPNKPNLFFNWAGGSIREYAEADLLVDLTPKLTSDTTWRDTFVKSVLDAGKIGDKYYDIPLKGMQPVLLFYNKTMFADVGVKPPETWDDIKSLVNTFKQKEITPFVLGGQDSWTELMYLEFLVDRLGGPEVFQRVENGDTAGWGDPVFLKSLEMIRELVDMGAFGTNYSSIGYGNGSASALFAKGKAAMHLMGTWEFTSQQGSNPKFVKNDLDYTNFPAVDGGKGDPRDTAGNPTNYFAVTKTDVSDACVDFLHTQMTNKEYIDAMIKAGEVPAIADLGDRLDQHPNPAFAKAVYEIAQTAPSFTLSWDQALPSNIGDAVVTNLQKVFNKQIQPADWVAAMKNAN